MRRYHLWTVGCQVNVADSAISIALVLLVLVAIRPSLAAAGDGPRGGDDRRAGGTDA